MKLKLSLILLLVSQFSLKNVSAEDLLVSNEIVEVGKCSLGKTKTTESFLGGSQKYWTFRLSYLRKNTEYYTDGSVYRIDYYSVTENINLGIFEDDDHSNVQHQLIQRCINRRLVILAECQRNSTGICYDLGNKNVEATSVDALSSAVNETLDID